MKYLAILDRAMCVCLSVQTTKILVVVFRFHWVLSFPIIYHKLEFFVLHDFENILDKIISHINLNSMHHNKLKSALKAIQLVTISNFSH